MLRLLLCGTELLRFFFHPLIVHLQICGASAVFWVKWRLVVLYFLHVPKLDNCVELYCMEIKKHFSISTGFAWNSFFFHQFQNVRFSECEWMARRVTYWTWSIRELSTIHNIFGKITSFRRQLCLRITPSNIEHQLRIINFTIVCFHVFSRC